MSLFDVYGSDQMIDLLDSIFGLKGFSEANKQQCDDDAIECECRVVDEEDEPKMIE